MCSEMLQVLFTISSFEMFVFKFVKEKYVYSYGLSIIEQYELYLIAVFRFYNYSPFV